MKLTSYLHAALRFRMRGDTPPACFLVSYYVVPMGNKYNSNLILLSEPQDGTNKLAIQCQPLLNKGA